MKRHQAPWWLYVVAASLCAYAFHQMYLDFWGPERINIFPDFTGGRMVLRAVSPDSAGARAGLQPGDHIVAIGGQAIHSVFDWIAIRTNFEVGRPIRLEIERGDKRFEVTTTLGRKVWGQRDRADKLLLISSCISRFIALLLASVVAFSRPRDSVALLGAALVTLFASPDVSAYGFAATWRNLPAPAGALFWIAFLFFSLGPPLAFTFCAVFPRKVFHSPWPLRVVWTLGVAEASFRLLIMYRMVYRPEHATGVAQNVHLATSAFENLFFLLGAALVVANYRSLNDVNERRRVRILILGGVLGYLAFLPIPIIGEFFPHLAPTFFSSPLPVVGFSLSLLTPVSFAYAVLRHRLFDIRVMLRQGLRYALARGFVLSAVPMLVGISLIDLWLHGDQPLGAVLGRRVWIYASLAGLGLVAYAQRRKWLESLDRRFFRERYDAQRLLRDVVEGVRVAQSLEQEAPRVVARIEAALHPEFTALLVREARDSAFRTLASVPASNELAAFPTGSKLLALVRLLGKPLEMPHSDSGWLEQQLPREETDFLRRTRIDLLAPVTTLGSHTEALLVLGAKRSEEPYSGEDQDLLVAISASLAILLEKPSMGMVSRPDIFQECPECGACYDLDIRRCTTDSVALVPVALARLLGGRYRLDRRLGRGGMGAVYEASDAALERRVALKVVREDLLSSAEATERFRREARAAAAFAHPNVVTVYDFGLTAGNRAFLVMELLRGATLRGELRKETRLTVPHTLTILSGVCAAIEAAHGRDLVHRDLKPENIFLARSDSQEIPKVLDFGVAKFVSNPAQEATVDTGSGVLLGTVRYMSPEQLRGGSASPAWDLWALAVVAYEMLTGTHPFAAERAIVAGEATPLTTYLPAAPESLQAFFDRALARDTAQRPRSAAAFLHELQRSLKSVEI